MTVSHTWTIGLKNDSSSQVIADTYTYSADVESNFNVAVPAGTTTLVTIPITVANLVSFYMESDQPVTLKTNSSTTPIQTFVMLAKTALAWNSGNNPNTGTNPLTTNVTAIYVVNSGSATATVKGGFLLNQ